MRIPSGMFGKKLPALVAAVSMISLILFTFSGTVSAVPTGKNFDHIVIIAMENQNYPDVFGTGTGTSAAPFLSSLLPYGTTVPNYHSYGAGGFTGDSISGCSAACYVALIGGSDYGVSDGYSCCLTGTTLVDQMQTAGLAWQAFCENGCPRGNDHFPFTGFASDTSSPNVVTTSTDFTYPSDPIYAAFNSSHPANLLWLTPTDSHNMHDVSIQTGDAYLQQLLVGTGTFSNPSPGSLLTTNVFKLRTELYIWWDENDPSPNIQVGFGNAPVKQGYVSTSNSYDQFASLHTIEDNWGLGTLLNSASAPITTDIFGTSPPQQPQPNTQPGSGGNCALCSITGLLPTFSLLTMGLIAGGIITSTIFLARYHGHNRRLRAMLEQSEPATSSRRARQKPGRPD